MSSDLSVPRVGAATAAVDAARPRSPTPHGHGSVEPGEKTVPATPTSLPNPTLRLDPGLAIVVIEFRDEAGAVRSTIPTEQQLEAYRTWDRGHAGDSARGAHDAGAGGPSASTPDTGAHVVGDRLAHGRGGAKPGTATPVPGLGHPAQPAPHAAPRPASPTAPPPGPVKHSATDAA